MGRNIFTPLKLETGEKTYEPNDDSKAKNESYCLRFLRKKYQCFIIYTLLIIVFIQNVIPKINEEYINRLLDKIISPKSRNVSEFYNFTDKLIE